MVIHLFKFIGDAPAFKTARNWFILRIEGAEFDRCREVPFPSGMSGVVVASKNRQRPVGHVSHNWCNPFRDMLEYGNPATIKINTIVGIDEAEIECKLNQYLREIGVRE